MVAPEGATSPEQLELATVLAEYGPLTEAMYLMMTADGSISTEEREVLRGALKNLSDDAVRTHHIEALMEAAKKNCDADGRQARIKTVSGELREDPARAEVAFVLAAAIAFADGAIADDENETLNTMAEYMSIDEGKANQLLDDVEADMLRAS